MLIIDKIIEKKNCISIRMIIKINQKNNNRFIYSVFLHRRTINMHLIHSNYFRRFIWYIKMCNQIFCVWTAQKDKKNYKKLLQKSILAKLKLEISNITLLSKLGMCTRPKVDNGFNPFEYLAYFIFYQIFASH